MALSDWIWGWNTRNATRDNPKYPEGVSSNPTRGRKDEDEKLLSGPIGVRMPYFLPFFDELQSVGETELQRFAYRRMLADPNVKGPLLGKVFGIAGLELRLNPTDKEDERQIEQADFLQWNYTRRLHGGFPGLAWSILIGGLIDGFSICEPVWGVQDRGKYKDKEILRKVKAKDVNQDLVVEADQFRNLTGIRALRYNTGVVWKPDEFIIFHHLPLYCNPTGMSDLRAAYARYWFLDTVIKLRAMGAEKRALPFIWGEYPDASKQSSLEAALARVKSQNWAAVPAEAKIQVLDIAGSANDYFKSFCDDLREEIVLAIEGATLHSMAGRGGQERGDTLTHKDTADLRKWFLSVALLQCLNDEEDGLNKKILDKNYTDIEEYPYATLGGVDDNELMESLDIDRGLQDMGFEHIVGDIAERYGRTPATEGDEVLKSVTVQQMEIATSQEGGEEGGGGGSEGGGGGSGSSKETKKGENPEKKSEGPKGVKKGPKGKKVNPKAKRQDRLPHLKKAGAKAIWTPFQGPRKGTGWKNRETGSVVYGAKPQS